MKLPVQIFKCTVEQKNQYQYCYKNSHLILEHIVWGIWHMLVDKVEFYYDLVVFICYHYSYNGIPIISAEAMVGVRDENDTVEMSCFKTGFIWYLITCLFQFNLYKIVFIRQMTKVETIIW